MKRLVLCAAIAAVCAGSAQAQTFGSTDVSLTDALNASRQETYIVLFQEPGLLYNEGQVRGFAPTAPSATGRRKLDVRTPAAEAYRAHLREQQDAYLTAIANAIDRSVAAKYRYDVTNNGIALELTAAEAEKVRRVPGVVSVRPAGTYELSGDRQPFFIGADRIWDGTAVPSGTPANVRRGQGIVVGVIDSGVNLTHPSFAPMPAGGDCGFASPTVKLIASRNCINDSACTAGSGGADLNGHGTHTAGSSAGNVVPAGSVSPGVPATTIQGVAPCAQIITYRVCEQSTCDGAAIFASFQAAIADQVDVINFSISGGTNPWSDNDRLKLDAVNADIFVAASAGNTSTSVPNPIGAVNHRGPWVMSVGNSTDDRPNQGANARMRFTVGSPPPPPPLSGEQIAYPLGPPLLAETNREIRFNAANPLGCTANGGFPSGFFNNAIALIQRGTCTFEEKLNNAQAAGAVGGIIFNNAAGVPNFNAGAATLPSAAVEQALGEALRDFIVANGSTPTRLNVTVTVRNGGVLNAGSLRGPNNSFDVTKPDITGPGTNVYDAYIAPQLFAFLTGTSMSGPHIAGGGALIRAVRPTWTPMEVHSALMMTANRDQWLPDIITPATPDDVGTGMIDLTRAALAGFVLNETYANFLAANPANQGNPRRLNIASMRRTTCTDTCKFVRTIRNTVTLPTNWTISTTAPTGVTIRTSPNFTFSGTTTETRDIAVIVDIAPSTTISTTVFGEVRFTETNGRSPPLVWTVAIRGSGTGNRLFADGLEGSD